ncbi:MAG: leucyl/phenylalanyl-tRNA--protein transferase [Ignavibacteria bacterium]
MNNNGDYISEDDSLKPENMIRLYANGAFPMADESGKLDWYMPEIRTVIPLDEFNCPRSLRKFMNTSGFEYRIDSDYFSVINSCAGRNPTWISDQLIEAYSGLYRNGYLHSVETWLEGELVGGLYGIAVRGAFFGESMFSKVPQASKASFVKLAEHLKNQGFALIDVQYQTGHLEMFGAREITLSEYDRLLREAYLRDCGFSKDL